MSLIRPTGVPEWNVEIDWEVYTERAGKSMENGRWEGSRWSISFTQCGDFPRSGESADIRAFPPLLSPICPAGQGIWRHTPFPLVIPRSVNKGGKGPDIRWYFPNCSLAEASCCAWPAFVNCLHLGNFATKTSADIRDFIPPSAFPPPLVIPDLPRRAENFGGYWRHTPFSPPCYRRSR